MQWLLHSVFSRIAASCLLILLLVQCSAPDNTDKTNLLVIMVDDLGYNDLAVNNRNAEIHTPNMDSIANAGMRFTRHYAKHVCSPARAAFLTGQYPERLGFLPNARGIPAEVRTMPEHLQSLGYTTWHLGKWHLGDEYRQAWPDRQGFDHWFGFLNQWRLAGKRTNGEVRLSKPRYQNPYLEGDRAKGRIYEGHLDDILTQKALDVLSELSQAQAPWFLNLWLYAPHHPVHPSSEFAALYEDSPEGRYRALVQQLDNNVGRISAHLKKLGLDDNTIVVIVSDNGGTNKAIDNNKPFAGRKGTVTEGALRTPLIIKWLDPAMNSRVVTDTVSIEDLYPTLMQALGFASVENVDGINHFANLKHQRTVEQRELFWLLDGYAQSYTALSADGDQRLYQPSPYYGAPLPQKMFDLNEDPSSRTTAELPQAQAHLGKSLAEWFKDVMSVSLGYSQTNASTAKVTGRDFQRTPGFGGFTVAITFPQDYQGSLVAQPTIWSLAKTGKKVIADFGVAELQGELTGDSQCQSAVLSGNFYKKTALIGPPSKITMALYLNGEKTDTVEVNAELTLNDLSIATLVGDTSSKQPLQPPVFMSAQLTHTTPVTAEAFSKALCQ
ncbi:MAG: sulfatase-like hydrolase/transferase [Halioglobus sp.]